MAIQAFEKNIIDKIYSQQMMSFPPILTAAFAYCGVAEIKGVKHSPIIIGWLKALGLWWRDDETAWCGVFLMKVVRDMGLNPPSDGYRALAWQNYGLKLPAPAVGCIGVKSRKGGGHVTIIVGKLADGRLVGFGGNQNNRVQFSIFAYDEFIAFRWIGIQPLRHRYALPVFTLTDILPLGGSPTASEA